MKLDKILKSSFVKNVGKLASGTLLAQIITFLSIPILTRLYSKEAFGYLITYTAVVTFISSFATLKYDTALVLPKEDKHAYALLKLSNIVTMIITLLCILIMFFPIEYFKKYEGLQLLIGLSVILSVNYNNSALWNIRNKNFKNTAIAMVVQAIFIFLFQYILYKYIETKGLIIGSILGIMVSGIYLLLTRKMDWALYKKIDKVEMLEQAKRYIDFPKYFTISNAILSFSASLPIFLFIKYIPISQIGIYGLALKIISQPVALLANSAKSVIMVDMANRRNKLQPIFKWYLNIFIGLFLISLIISIGLTVFGDMVITFFLGEEWVKVSIYAKMLIPLLIGMMIASPGVAAVRVFEMQKFNFYYSIITLFIKFLVLFFLLNNQIVSFEMMIFIYALISLLMILVNNFIILLKVRNYEKKIKLL